MANDEPPTVGKKLWHLTNHQVIGGLIVVILVGIFTTPWTLWGGSGNSTKGALSPASQPSPTYVGVRDGSDVVVADFTVSFGYSGENGDGMSEWFKMLPAKKVRWKIMDDSEAVASFNVAGFNVVGLPGDDLMLCVKDGQVTDSFDGRSLYISKVERADGKYESTLVHFRVYRVE